MEDNRHDFYGSFNLSTNASDEEIRVSFRRLSRFLHPDKQETHNKKVAEAAFSRLQFLKEVLTNPTTRYIYDRYGELGLSLAAKRKNVTSFLINDLEKRKDLDNKIQDLVLKAHFQKMQSAINYRGTCGISYSLSDYLDSSKTFKSTPWSEKFSFSSLSLNECVRFHLTSRLLGDLGFFLHANENDSSLDLTGKLAYRFDSGILAQCNYQVGNSITSTYTLSKTIGNVNFYLQASLANSVITPSFTVMRMFDNNKSVRMDLTAGNNPSASLSLDHVVSDKFKTYYKFHQFHHDAELETGLSYKIFRFLTVRLGNKITSKIVGKKNLLIFTPNCGFSTKINGFMSFGYGVESDLNGVSVYAKAKRGHFALQVPIRLSKFITPKTLLICTGGALIATLLSYILGKSISNISGSFSKSETSKFKELEKYQEQLQVLQEIKSMIKPHRQQEKSKNGLIIQKAFYGKVWQSLSPGPSSKVIDVKWVLQGQVEDSRLFLRPGQLSSLSGIFDPCSNSVLFIQYQFGSMISECFFKNDESIVIP
jgi:DnaJ family protein C protein 11